MKKIMPRGFAALLLMLLVLVACADVPAEPAPDTGPAANTAAAVPATEAAAEAAAPAAATAVSEPAPTEPAVTLLTEPTLEPVPRPIEVTYITPAQQEGPYYPVEKPADRDNDLATLTGASGMPAGQVIEFGGTVYDAGGVPFPGIVIEIWQTDTNGIYLHPGDPQTADRDQNFQFYGEAETAVDGSYRFRTILPGQYEPRPRHIHVKFKRNGQELLTTQFYFTGEVTPQGDAASLLIDLTPVQEAAGNEILVGQRDVVLGVELSDG